MRTPSPTAAATGPASVSVREEPVALIVICPFSEDACPSSVHVAHAHGKRGPRWADDPAAIAAMQRKVPDSMGACFDLIEREMLKGPWVMGENYKICDPYLFTFSQMLEGDGVDPARFPRVIEHRKRMSERPGVRKAVAEELA
jgi:glutathione S-transferase